MKIFISYSSLNRPYTQDIATDLEDIGHEVWFDRELTGGQAWWDSILAAIRNCDSFLFILTQEWLDSNPCQLEFKYAEILKRPMLPILHDANLNVRTLPTAIQAMQLVNYTQSNTESFKKLVKALHSLPAAPSLPKILPPPPPAPISPLGEIAEQIRLLAMLPDLPRLFTQQKNIVEQLSELLKNPTEAKGAQELLRLLGESRYIFWGVQETIQAALKQPLPKPPAVTPKETEPTPARDYELFDVYLVNVGVDKINTIKVIRRLNDMGLAEAKALADSPPSLILQGVIASTAHNAEREFKEVGAKVEIRPSH